MINGSTSILPPSRGTVIQRLAELVNGLTTYHTTDNNDLKIMTVTNRRLLGFITILLLTFTTSISFSQTTDSTQLSTITTDTLSQYQTDNFHEELEDNFSPGLGLFAIFAFGFMFICIGAGIVLTIIALLILFGLIGAGILSASVLIGLYNKSFEKGFKTFIVSATTIGGLFIGATGFWFLNKIVHWFTTQIALTIGSVGGLLTGFVLGLLVFYVLQKLTAFLKDKLKTT
jgi:hypothetical protein